MDAIEKKLRAVFKDLKDAGTGPAGNVGIKGQEGRDLLLEHVGNISQMAQQEIEKHLGNSPHKWNLEIEDRISSAKGKIIGAQTRFDSSANRYSIALDLHEAAANHLDEVREVLLHEIGHAKHIDEQGHEGARKDDPSGHNTEWQQYARSVGSMGDKFGGPHLYRAGSSNDRLHNAAVAAADDRLGLDAKDFVEHRENQEEWRKVYGEQVMELGQSPSYKHIAGDMDLTKVPERMATLPLLTKPSELPAPAASPAAPVAPVAASPK